MKTPSKATKLLHWLITFAGAKAISSLMGYKERAKTFASNYIQYIQETARLDNHLDTEPGVLEDKLSILKEECYKILEKEHLPRRFHSKAEVLIEKLCQDYGVLHRGESNGAIDVLKRKAESYSKLILLTLIGKIFPEVNPNSARVKFCMKVVPKLGMMASGIDDLLDIEEDFKTPHLNFYLTWRADANKEQKG